MPHRKLQTGWVDIVVGANARKFRVAKQVEIQEVADKIGIPVIRLIACEAGSVRFEALHLYVLSRALGVTVTQFFDDSDLYAPKKSEPVNLRLVYTAS